MKFLVKFYNTYLKCPDVGKFDPEFQQMLQILYFFGWYQPQPTKLRTAYGVFTFFFVFVSYFLGASREAIAAHKVENIFQTMLYSALVINLLPQMITIIVIALQPRKLTELIKTLHELHEFDDNEAMKALSHKCCKMVKFYKFFLLAASSASFLMHGFGFELFALYIPAIYDRLAVGVFYYPFLVFNAVHLIASTFVLLVCDLLPILCIVRIVKNKQFLAYDFLHSTDDDKRTNEINIDAAGLYDSTIRGEFTNLKKIFGKYFFTKFVALFFGMLFSVYILVESKLKSDPSSYVFGILIMAYAVSAFGLLCYFGERLKTVSQECFDATYLCDWYSQTKRFKKSLLIIREVNMQPMEIRIPGGWALNHETFAKVIFAVYTHYNNLVAYVGAMRLRRIAVNLRARFARRF